MPVIFKYARIAADLARILATPRKLLLIAPHTELLAGNALGLALAAQASADFLPVVLGKRPGPLEIPTCSRKSRLMPLLRKRADVIACTGHYHTEFAMGAPRAFRLFLWHGMPIKGIGAFDPFDAGHLRPPCDLAIATSQRTSQIMAQSFGFAPEKIAITGEPKTDYLSTNRPGWDWASSLRLQYRTIIGYLPTWREKLVEIDGRPWRRDDDEALLQLVGELVGDAELRNLLERHRAAFVIRMHPKHAMAAPLSPPFFSMDDARGDATHLLQECDAIIGDYSSVVIDALLFDRPLALWCPDLEHYARLRPLPYFNFHDTFGWALKATLPALRHWIAQRLQSHPLNAAEVDGIARCRAIFHRHARGGAGDRVLESVRARLQGRSSA